jgi:hypothetical protein
MFSESTCSGVSKISNLFLCEHFWVNKSLSMMWPRCFLCQIINLQTHQFNEFVQLLFSTVLKKMFIHFVDVFKYIFIFTVGARSSRRSVGGLSFSPMNMSMTCGQSSAHGQQPQHHKSSAGGFFASWRRSYRMRSKSTASSAHNNVSRKQDTKSMENLLNNRTPR